MGIVLCWKDKWYRVFSSLSVRYWALKYGEAFIVSYYLPTKDKNQKTKVAKVLK